MRSFGLSSATVPRWSGEELLRAADDHDLGCVDLRAGRGHGWERDDLGPLFSGLRVCFVGVGVELGGTNEKPLAAPIRSAMAKHRTALRCFLAPNIADAPALAAAARRRDALAETYPGSEILVELHRAAPSIADADRALTALGLRAVVDNRGVFLAAGGDTDAAADFAARHGAAIQLKGFRLDAPTSTHIPLAGDSLAFSERLLKAAPDVNVTVETRAGTWASDLHSLRVVTR